MTGLGPSGPRANFGQRLVALLIDGVILFIVFLVLSLAVKTVGYVLAIVISAGYFSYFEGGPTGQTLGKRVMGIRVYDFSSTGGPIGYGRGLIRWLGRIVSSFVCYLGYFWMLWDKEKQCWHDKIATTVVVPVSAYPVQ
jgi:uncharacterized RDD family membrane protein YckC